MCLLSEICGLTVDLKKLALFFRAIMNGSIHILLTKDLVLFHGKVYWQCDFHAKAITHLFSIYKGPSFVLGTGDGELNKELSSPLSFIHSFIEQIPVLGTGYTTISKIEKVPTLGELISQ